MTLSPAIRSVALLALLASASLPSPAQTRRTSKPQLKAHTAQENSNLAGEAVKALFVDSDIQRARRLASDALALTGMRDQAAALDPLFVTMEAAALQGDLPVELDAAVRLCEMRAVDRDPRVSVAAARLLDHAANKREFRAVVPRIVATIAAGSAQSSYLRGALLTAAKDGMPGLSVPELAQASGLITDWAVVGPFGKYSNISFDQRWQPENDLVRRNSYGERVVEHFRFDDGTFELPDYLSMPGVLYAAADVSISAPGHYRIRAESAGTLQVSVDGRLVVKKDDRLRITPEVVSGEIDLTPGRHRIAVKFISKAAPFRLSVIKPQAPGPTAAPAITSAIEAAYVSAAREYWNGDYGTAIGQLTELRRQQPSTAVDMLLAQAWEHLDETSPEPVAIAQEALKLAPGTIAAESMLGMSALSQQRFEDAVTISHQILEKKPDFEPALRVLATSATSLEWHAEATDAYAKLIKQHPSCSLLQEAFELAGGLSEFETAKGLQTQLLTCAPSSLAWAEVLSKAGDHLRAADALKHLVAARPLDRTAREFLVRELALAGNQEAAVLAADELVRIAPGSREYRQLSASLHRGELPQTTPSHMAGFAEAVQFYSPYRRDSLVILKETENRHFSGGPAVTLLNDRVVQLTSDNLVNLYIHKITRVLNRDGILQYGEVAVPNGASVLALRTIKSDGAIAEPELSQHKPTISMPALAPGDAIDLEYVLRYPDGNLNDHLEAFEFTFGSFAAPILLSRFVVLSPADVNLQFIPSGDVPSVKVQETNEQVARQWERNNIAQSVSEISMPRSGLLPSMRVLPEAPAGWAGIRDNCRDALIDAVQIGFRVESAAAGIAGMTDEQKMRAAYRFVSTRVHQSAPLFNDADDATSAEKTLAAYSGNRTAALLAIARAIGLSADLVMARDAAMARPEAIGSHIYTRPLVLLHAREAAGVRDILVDAETEGIGFGGVAPTIERKDALLVSLDNPDDTNLIVSLPGPIFDDQSTAVADVTFDEQGNLAATLEIHMGAPRSAQMRTILSGVEAVNRKHFFEQLAMRIFPGATDATGEVRNEFDPDRPLELVVRCRALHFANFTGATADLDQLAPALGLRKMYASGGSRREPLFIDTPLIETATFDVRLPGNMRFSFIPPDVSEHNEFGEYSVSFRDRTPSHVQVRRDFRVPVQVVEPARFDAFSRFARRIDDAERQRLTIERLDQVSSAGTR